MHGRQNNTSDKRQTDLDLITKARRIQFETGRKKEIAFL